MSRILMLCVGMLPVSISVSAAELTCGVRLSKDTPMSRFSELAKISKSEAEKSALAKIKGSHKEVTGSDFGIERGCLVYSFDIKVASKPGVDSIFVDAGTGKVLLQKPRTPRYQALEHGKRTALHKNLEWTGEPVVAPKPN